MDENYKVDPDAVQKSDVEGTDPGGMDPQPGSESEAPDANERRDESGSADVGDGLNRL